MDLQFIYTVSMATILMTLKRAQVVNNKNIKTDSMKGLNQISFPRILESFNPEEIDQSESLVVRTPEKIGKLYSKTSQIYTPIQPQRFESQLHQHPLKSQMELVKIDGVNEQFSWRNVNARKRSPRAIINGADMPVQKKKTNNFPRHRIMSNIDRSRFVDSTKKAKQIEIAYKPFPNNLPEVRKSKKSFDRLSSKSKTKSSKKKKQSETHADKNCRVSTRRNRSSQPEKEVGKLSKSRISMEVFHSKELCEQGKIYQTKRQKSPGFLTPSKSMFPNSHFHNSRQESASTSRFSEHEKDLPDSAEKQTVFEFNKINVTDPKNAFFIQKIKKNQLYLKSMIQRSHARKNRHLNSHLLRNHNALGNVQESKASNIRSFVSTPRSKYEQKSQFSSVIDKPQKMKINSEVEVSFLIKSSKVRQNEFTQESSVVFAPQQRESQVSFYSPKINKKYNDRKLKFQDRKIDSSIEADSSLNNSCSANQECMIKQMLRALQNQIAKTKQTENGYTQQLSLKTNVSTLKQILIEAPSDYVDIKFNIPLVFDQTERVHSELVLSEVHWIVQKLFCEISLKPEIVTIKRYQNAIFAGVNLNKTCEEKDVSLFKTLIWHYDGSIYFGDWKQKSSQSEDDRNTQVVGSKQGLGMLIRNSTGIEPQYDKTVQNRGVQLYYGQFRQNLMHGYGVRFNVDTKEDKKQLTVQVGCWENNQRHGWIKTFRNGARIDSAEYDQGIRFKSRDKV